MIEDYAWRGGREAMLRFGQSDWPTLVILPPLFEEANRTRSVIVALMRLLAAKYEIASVLPDLPGSNDSTVQTEDARFEDWADAVASLCATLPAPRLTVAVRGGALLDRFAGAEARWRLAPETGARMLRDMIRATAISSGEKTGDLSTRAGLRTTLLGGNLIHPALFAALESAAPDVDDKVRTAQLDDRGDVEVGGMPVWRGAEPQQDHALVSGMAEDLCNWVNRCVAR